MSSDGYIKVWRKMLDSEVMQDDWLCRLWLWCLLKAQWQDSKDLRRGQFITGRARASDELRVSPSMWYRGVERLRDLGCIELLVNSNRTTITVCNYCTYQDQSQESEQRLNNVWTADEQRLNSATIIEEEGKKERKGAEQVEIKIPAAIDTPAFSRSWSDWLDYRRKSRQTMRPETLNRQLAMLAGLGEEAAIECVECSLRNGWKGLFPPKEKKTFPTKITLTESVNDGAEWLQERNANDAG